MRCARWLLLLLICACTAPTGPRANAQLVDGWWFVRLADGSVCIARPFQAPIRDTAAEAIAECQEAAQ